MKAVFLITFLLVTAHCIPVSNLLISISANQPWFMHSELLVILKPQKTNKQKYTIIGIKATIPILSFFGAESSSFTLF